MDDAVPVTVVTGFLGAGKTTLVNRWLREEERGDVAVVINEHGDVPIDGALLVDRAREIVEIGGGCVCCATQGELVRALDDLARSRPRRILVETSGAASPAGVVRAVARGAQRLDGVITVVDATRMDTLREHELAIEQVGYADVVVLSRTDLSGEASRAVELVSGHNGAALVVAGVTESFEALLDRRRADFATSPRAVPPASHAYESVSLVIEGDLDGERFADFMESHLARFAGRIFRTKGILALDGAEPRMIVQGVADLVEVTFGAPWGDAKRTSRLVVVGFGLDRDSLARAFATCAVRP